MSAKFDDFLKCENVGLPNYDPEKTRAAFEAVSAPSAAEQANIEELRRIADAAEEQAKLAKAEAEAARVDTKFSRWMSIISILIAAASFLSSRGLF